MKILHIMPQRIIVWITITLGATAVCHALQQPESSSSSWRPLPDPLEMGRRTMLLGTAAAAMASAGTKPADAFDNSNDNNNNSMAGQSFSSIRSVASIGSNVAIPVWPTWGGGRVVPVSLGGPDHDPFLLLAHHKHWFDPRDPLRKPFQTVGKVLGLPYVDVEGFSMHPHRGFDILTYILDGSDGFRHRDSLGKSTKIYRGGCAQWMRTGAGVLHEEFWETRDDRRTNIELFQVWVNLPAKQKLDVPHIQYVGTNTEFPWLEHNANEGVHVRDIGATLDASLIVDPNQDKDTSETKTVVNQRPAVNMLHVTIKPGTQWEAPVSNDHSAVVYVREGAATFPLSLTKDYSSQKEQTANALQTATFRADGNSIVISNRDRKKDLDFLLLAGSPLREPVVLGGPIVMNSEEELNDAYRQLSNGTFLKRDVVLRQQADTLRWSGRSGG
jgi:redox-sensitive bicupin YhaK (pirin superfamily)